MSNINNKNYKDLALENYINKQCLVIDEFNKDIQIIHQLNKQFNLYINRQQYMNKQFIFNIIITTFNNFNSKFSIELLFFIVNVAFHEYLCSVLYYLGLEQFKNDCNEEFLKNLEVQKENE